jgi:predicted PurR-regulated permease PerM
MSRSSESPPITPHPGWSLATRYFVLVLLLAGLLLLAWQLRPITGPLTIAALLAYILNPLVNGVKKRLGLPRRYALGLVYSLFLLILMATPITFFPVVVNQARALADEFSQIGQELTRLFLEIETVLGWEISLVGILLWVQTAAADLLNVERALQVIQRLTTNLIWILVILVVPYYLLQDWDKLREWLLNLGPPAYKRDVRRLYDEIKAVWHNYLRGQLLLMFIVGVSSALAGAAIGLPGALLLGLLAGVLDVIPSLGPAVAMILAVAIAWFEGSTYLPISTTWFALLVVAVYSLIQVVENVWLRPRIMARSLQMHPAVIFLAVVGALVLIGPLMALIAVPLLGSTVVVSRYVWRRLGGVNPWPENVPESVPGDRKVPGPSSEAKVHG